MQCPAVNASMFIVFAIEPGYPPTTERSPMIRLKHETLDSGQAVNRLKRSAVESVEVVPISGEIAS